MLYLSADLSGKVESWPLDGETIRLGRSSRHPIHVPDGTVSKDHAEIVHRAGHWTIRDCGSRNGTRVNGVDARDPLEIRAGDRIEVGHVQFRVLGQPPGQQVHLNDATVLGSSLRLKAGEILERRSRSPGGSGRLVRLLADAGRLLVLPRPLPETCDELLRFVEEAVRASRYVLLLRGDEGGEPVQMAARTHGGRANRPLALSRAIMRKVLDECTSVLTADAAADPRFQHQQSIVTQSVHSAMAVPLFDNERVLGLIYVDSHEAGMAFSEEQLELLTLLANMAAVKITNARLLQTEQAHARMAHELATAAQIQRGLLPVAPPEVPGYHFDAFLESCYEVGGDLYDFHRAGDGRLLCAVGDVTGKGMGAALLMSSFLSSLRVLYETCADLGELARRLNAITWRSTDAVRYVTGVIARLEPASGTLEVVNAGHPAPTLALGGELRKLESGGAPFGILPESDYAVETVRLRPGELLAVCSDGIPEARHGDDFFDDQRLDELLREARGTEDLATLRSQIVSRVMAFVGDEPRSDDITLLLLRRDR